MAAFPSRKEVQRMVLQKMRSQNPLMYRELEASGDLEKVAQLRADLLEEVSSWVENQGLTQIHRKNLPFQEHVNAHEAVQRSAIEQGLAAALEFAREQPGFENEPARIS